jgi:hypothetical protein
VVYPCNHGLSGRGLSCWGRGRAVVVVFAGQLVLCAGGKLGFRRVRGIGVMMKYCYQGD